MKYNFDINNEAFNAIINSLNGCQEATLGGLLIKKDYNLKSS